MIDMLADPNKSETNFNLISILEDELNWLISKQYTSQGPYQALLEAIHNIPLHPSEELDCLARQLQTKFQELSFHIGEKFKAIIDLSIGEVNHLKEKIVELQREMHDMEYHNQTLEETIESLHEKLSQWQSEYDTLRLEATDMQQKYEQELKHSRKEKKQLRRTFLQVQEETQQERKLFEDLHIEREEISQQIIEEKKMNEILMEEIQRLKNRLEENEHKATASAKKIQYEERQIFKLEEEIEEKNKLIEQLYQAQRPKVDSLSRHPSDLQSLKLPQDNLSSGHLTKRITFVQKFKLADQIHINQNFDQEFKRSASIRNSLHSSQSRDDVHEELRDQININSTIIEQEIESSRLASSSKIKYAHSPDIYYSHYLLTVQAVKLKMDRQDIFEINISSHDLYEKMIGEVKFHEWDTWIEKQLSQGSHLKK